MWEVVINNSLKRKHTWVTGPRILSVYHWNNYHGSPLMICTHYLVMRIVPSTRRYLADFTPFLQIEMDGLHLNSPSKWLSSRAQCANDFLRGKAILNFFERKGDMFGIKF